MLLAPLLACSMVLAQEDGRPDALELASTAERFLPRYEYETRAFLDEELRRDVIVARMLLDASLLLDDRIARAHRWRGHCEVLLAENAGNRGHEEEGRSHRQQALRDFDRAIELEPDTYWTHYARGTALAQLDRHWEAIASYDQAELLVEEWLDTMDDAAQVLYYLRQWRADTRMRTLELEQAREELRVFYAAYGSQQGLGVALAETYLRERDFSGARAACEDMLADEGFVPYPEIYEQIANIAGLVEAGEEASGWLRRSFDHEREPSMYRRLWLWILTSGDQRAEVRGELEEFLRYPPSSLSEWDRTLGRFVLGEGTVDDFLAAAEVERTRRSNEGILQDDLPCEVWFYAGLRHEHDAERPGATPVVENLHRALDAYRRALAFRPRRSKWEWEWARLRFARLAERLELEPHPGFEGEGRQLVLAAGAPLDGDATVRRGRLELVLRHVPGDERGTRSVGGLGDAPLAVGELVQCVVLDENRRRHVLSLVVDARN